MGGKVTGMAVQQITDRQRDEDWRARFAGEYKAHELDEIDRFWTSLGKKIAKRSRIRDARVGRKK